MSNHEDMHNKNTVGIIDTPGLRMAWSEAPWDTAVFNFPVLQITQIEAIGLSAPHDFTRFVEASDSVGAGLVSCRLSHECIKESMLLEDNGFRFIEMLYLPELDKLESHAFAAPDILEVLPAERKDLPRLLEIAGTAFANERFHLDPRLDSTLGNERYRRWVQSSFTHPSQRLYVVRDGLQRVAFFVTEMQADGTCYWHLNAVAPEVQGRGYGRRTWLAMIRQAKEANAKRVRSSIVARNHRVLNLYARLGFQFPPPLMTFHWVKNVQT